MLTKAQLKTYRFIKHYIEKHQLSPTTQEIAEGIGIQSRGVVYRYIKALVDAGKVVLTPNRHRNIALAEETTNSDFSLPLLGAIAAGHPIEAIAGNEHVNVTDIFAGPHRYALKVKGDSMIEEGIYDGDLVICQHVSTANSGQIVVALIDDQEATLKRIRFNPDRRSITLIPANPNYQPMQYPAERIKIQGIYIGLLRLPN